MLRRPFLPPTSGLASGSPTGHWPTHCTLVCRRQYGREMSSRYQLYSSSEEKGHFRLAIAPLPFPLPLPFAAGLVSDGSSTGPFSLFESAAVAV